MRVGGASIDGLQVPSGPVLVADQLPDSNPIKKVSMDFRAAYQKVNGAAPTDASRRTPTTPTCCWATRPRAPRASRARRPIARALRDAIMSTKELVGTHGIYNFKPDDRYGSDQRGVVIVRMDKGSGSWQP